MNIRDCLHRFINENPVLQKPVAFLVHFIWAIAHYRSWFGKRYEVVFFCEQPVHFDKIRTVIREYSDSGHSILLVTLYNSHDLPWPSVYIPNLRLLALFSCKIYVTPYVGQSAWF